MSSLQNKKQSGPFFIREWGHCGKWDILALEPEEIDYPGERHYLVVNDVSKECAQEHADRLNACVKLWLERQQDV